MFQFGVLKPILLILSFRRSKSKPDEGDLARISTLEKKIKTSEAELASLQQNADKINAEIQALEKKILDIGGSKLLAQKSKVDGIKVYINIATEEITKCEVNIATAEKDLKRLGDAIATKSSELAKVDEEVAKL